MFMHLERERIKIKNKNNRFDKALIESWENMKQIWPIRNELIA